MTKFEIVNRSENHGALMDEDTLLYELYTYKGHAYRLENGRITAADEADRRQVERSKAWKASFRH